MFIYFEIKQHIFNDTWFFLSQHDKLEDIFNRISKMHNFKFYEIQIQVFRGNFIVLNVYIKKVKI